MELTYACAEACRRAESTHKSEPIIISKDNEWAPFSCILHFQKVPTFSAQDPKSKCLDGLLYNLFKKFVHIIS